MMKYYAINGRVLPASEALLHINDVAILRGYGVFDFLQAREGVPMFFDDYLARFENSMRLMDMELPFSTNDIKNITRLLIAKNKFPHSSLRLVTTGGISGDGFTPSTPHFFILEEPMPPSPVEQYERGIKLILHEYIREIPEVKITNYVIPIRLQKYWKSLGAIDVLYHKNNSISESSRSNFFIINDKGVLVTSEHQILKGVTRKHVIHLAEKIMPVEVRDLTLDELHTAKEAFLTGSARGVLPVVKIDENIIGDGKVGIITKQIMHDFEAHSQAYIADKK